MDFLKRTLFSTRLMVLLFVTFAVSMAVGTFVESIYDTTTARIWIYNAWWFEIVILFFLINFVGNIGRYRLFRREKLPVLILHLAFIFIIIGAFFTRYISYEGVVSIREGHTADSFISEKTYLTLMIDGEYKGQMQRKTLKKHILLSGYADNDFSISDDFDGKPFKLTYKDYYPHSKRKIIEDDKGDYYLKIVESGSGTRHEHYLQRGQVSSIHNILFALDKPTEGAVNFNTQGDVYTVKSPVQGSYMRMVDRHMGVLLENTTDTLQLRSLYNLAGLQFVIPDPLIKGKYSVVPVEKNDPEAQETLFVTIDYNGRSRDLQLIGGQGILPKTSSVDIGDLEFHASYGSMEYTLPFSVTLDDFIAEKYPGTEKGYSSFKSKVTVADSGEIFNYDIYMNHILDYKGYRFFQTSFDPDEQGTVLSVNHDFWGTYISYSGYFLLYAGLLGLLFYGKNHFRNLSKQLKKLKSKQVVLIVFLSVGVCANAQNRIDMSKKKADSIIMTSAIRSSEAKKFGRIIIQDNGRMKPINTFSSELIRKLHKSETYMDLNADQMLLSMMSNPTPWYYTEIFYLKSKNDSIRKIIGVPKKQKYVRIIDFFDSRGNYKLNPFLKESYSTNNPNEFQKDFKDADLRLGIMNQILSRDILRLFPVPNHPYDKWISENAYNHDKTVVNDTLYGNFISNAINYYLTTLEMGEKANNFTQADKVLQAIKTNQQNYGADIMPSEKRISAEIIYNKVNIFERLFKYYLYTGLILLVILIMRIFKERRTLVIGSKILRYIIVTLFVSHTLGLVMRSYISGHAPWSDAYESMIYIAWATMGMGVLFTKKSDLTLASTAFVASVLLMIAHWNWLDPAIANLQPVLNSYWLMIHVAVIVASYGPFTLGMILGLLSLLLMVLSTVKSRERIALAIKEITIINELSLTVGLVMLTIGNFLGGQWANESWGRYWGWDPKETWALISIMVYAFVLHMRLVPGLRGKFAFNLASVVAYGSIMMTYFGVNFYLVGLHSYASGEANITPAFVYYLVAIVALVGLAAYRNQRRLGRVV